ncbi:MAG TPA: MlaD family protein [Armatimonadota bacterium]|jgi:phospholipid/cholesterol/gamma-HCH transport system substrate-binding protein
MAQTNAAAKVGAVVIGTAILLAAVLWFFLGRGIGGYPVDVSFKDAQGTKEGADVHLAGVKIGTVRKIDVDASGRRAVMHLNIFPDRRIPEGAIYTVTSGGLLGEMFVQISPDPKRDTGKFLPSKGGSVPIIVGTDLPTFDDLRLKANDFGEGANDIIKDLKRVTQHLATLSGDPNLQNSLKETAGNAREVSRQAVLAASRLNSVLDTEIPTLHKIMNDVESGTSSIGPITKNAELTTHNMAQMTANANRVVKNFDESITFLRATLKDTIDGAEIAPNAKIAMQNIAAASANFKAVSADAAKVMADLASTGQANSRVGEAIMSVQKVSEKASSLLDKINGVADKAGARHAPSLSIASQIDTVQTFGEGSRFRADWNLLIPRPNNTAYLLGLYDMGDGNKFNLQMVDGATQRMQIRYGIHASKLGAGADYLLKGAPAPAGEPMIRGNRRMTLDLYSPNNPHLDLMYQGQVTDSVGLGIGMQDLLHRGHPAIGLTYRK